MERDTHSVERHLSVSAEAYDVEIRRFIPGYDEMLATGVQVVRALAPADAHVLDLGGGTGALSAALLEALPGIRVTLLDVDPEMLAEAQRRLSGFGDRVAFQEGSFHDPLPPSDATVASLALHHIHDLTTKTDVYSAIREALSPGGLFLNLDAAVNEQPRINALTFAEWTDFMGCQGISPEEARGHFAAWADEDRYFSLLDELTALTTAGFAEVDCFWRAPAVAVYGGLAP